METKDSVTETTETTEDKSSQASEQKEQSSTKPALTEEDVNKRAQQIASDILSKRGDKAKTLEDRVKELEERNKMLVDKQLEAAAQKYNMTIEDVRDIGIDNPEQLDKVGAKISAALGKTQEQTKQTFRVDSAKNVGGRSESRADVISRYGKGEATLAEYEEATKK